MNKVNVVKSVVREAVKEDVNTQEVNNNKGDVVEMKTQAKEYLYFVLGRNGGCASAINEKGTNKVKMFLTAKNDYDTHTSVLCLEEINRILGILKEEKDNGRLEMPVNIRTINTLLKSFNTGNFKYWIVTGTYADGTPVNERELKAWKEFASLYGELYLFVNFNSQSISKMDKSPQAKIGRTIIKTMWDNLPKGIQLDKQTING